jgi:hypothetical protein
LQMLIVGLLLTIGIMQCLELAANLRDGKSTSTKKGSEKSYRSKSLNSFLQREEYLF